MKKQIALVCGLLCATLLVFGPVCTANAATVVLDPNDNTKAIGIQNLNILDTLYNVTFNMEASAIDVYGPFPGDIQPFTRLDPAAGAVYLMLALLNDSSATSVGEADSADSDTNFFVGYRSKRTMDPDGELFDDIDTVRGFFETIPEDGWIGDQYPLMGPYDLPVTYAEFQVVPLPGAVWLLGSGLLGVIGLRRKRPNT